MASEEQTTFKAIFDKFDKNSDGHITSGEIKNVLNSLGQNPTQADIDAFIRETDKDKNGTIEFKEFCAYLAAWRRKIFKEIDADGNGFITPEEMKSGYAKLGVDISLDDARKYIKECDTNKDGRIDYDEFVRLLHSKPILF